MHGGIQPLCVPAAIRVGSAFFLRSLFSAGRIRLPRQRNLKEQLLGVESQQQAARRPVRLEMHNTVLAGGQNIAHVAVERYITSSRVPLVRSSYHAWKHVE